MGDPRDVSDQQRVEGVEGLDRDRRQLPRHRREHPEPHDRSHGGQREQVGRERRQRERLEMVRHQRRGGQRRGDRQRRSLGEPAAQRRPVAPACVGRPLRRKQRVADRRGPKQDAGDRREAELPADIGARAGVDRQRRQRRKPERVPARPRGSGEPGDYRRRPHCPGALDRRPRAGHRYVDRDQHQDADEPRPQRDVERGEQRDREKSQQDDVLAADGQQVREARALELVDRSRIDAVVLAEHEPARQRRLGLRHPALERGLGAIADAVHQRRNTAAARSGERDAVRLEDGPDAVGSQVARAPRRRARRGVRSPRSRARSRSRAPARARVRAGGRRRSRPAPRRCRAHAAGPRSRSPAPRPAAGSPRGRRPRRSRAGARRRARRRRRTRSGRRDRASRRRPRRIAADAVTWASDAATPAAAAARRAPRQAARAAKRRPAARRRAGARRPPGRGASERKGAPVGKRADYGVSPARSASIVAGPMPLISSSSSTDEKPPCSSR